jgi:small-conductance mechanosensitive channel
MKSTRPSLLLTLLFGIFIAVSSPAQETEEDLAPAPPNFAALQLNWWSYFEGSQAEVEPRIAAFFVELDEEIPLLGAQNQETAASVLEAVRDNLGVYLSLLGDTGLLSEILPEAAASYSIDELATISATARRAIAAAAAEEQEVQREQRILEGASRRRDGLFKEYLDAEEGDERWLTALRLVRARTAQEISERRLAILTQSFELATTYADAATERLNIALERLTTDAGVEQLDELIADVEARITTVEAAQEVQREAQIAASSLDLDTAQSRSEQRLQQQKLLDADVRLGATRVALVQAEAKRWWTELKLDTDPDLETIKDTSLAASELIRDMGDLVPEWKRQTEDELLAVQSVDRDGLDRTSRRLLDQRLGTAQATLAQLGNLDVAISNLEMSISVVDNAVAESSGPFRSWLSKMSRLIETGWIRVTDSANATLFSVDDTPVTAGDIVQALIILIFAFLLSRGIRYAIRRVGEKESAGTQASLYTLGRLSHYTIVVLGLFISINSIGINFGNLALVAGALSVGIGFGLQSIVNNFVSGLVILFERSLRVGDYIELDTGLTGTVKAINVRSTLINTNDNIDIVVPNSEFVTTRLTNWTLGERILRVRIPFGVAYGSDKELVRTAAMEAAEEVPYTLTHMPGREANVWLVEYGDNSLNFLLLVWVNRQGARRPTRTRAAYLWALETKLSEYGIEIPFPQRDLHLRSGWPPVVEPENLEAKKPEPDGDE